ncbi:ABC transporter permease [Fodinisporobacter ferrooxydans]|uniref:ABC transporter permease n=1 Tax=Fodinisporobacter ferrooxydans TaxID=2901836 RepID=A0ABY4CNW3_9BACL|nr:ABC transporter permease [Alicyclobacillaceae bacterium MYW30-H2]
MTSTTMQKIITIHGLQAESLHMGLNPQQRQRLLAVGSPLALLCIWQLLDVLGWIDSKDFPAPSTILFTMYDHLLSGALWVDIKASLYRISLGFLFGAVPGIIIGLSVGLFPVVRRIVEPLVYSTYSIPKLAILPLLMLIFGLGETEKIILIALGVVYPVLINTSAGVLELDSRYLDVAKNFGASKLDYYRTVAIPGAIPMMFTGLKIGVAEALLLIVAAEMVGAQSGIGYRIWMSYEVYDMPTMFVSFLLMSALGYILSVLVDELETLIVPWKQKS